MEQCHKRLLMANVRVNTLARRWSLVSAIEYARCMNLTCTCMGKISSNRLSFTLIKTCITY